MMQSIKKIMVQMAAATALVCLAGLAAAGPLDGVWQFERSGDYFGRTPANQAPRFSTLVVRDKEVSLSDTCMAKFSPDDYLFSDVFQPLTKQGITDKQVDGFLMKNFHLSLLNTREVYSLTSSPQNCARPVMEFFMVGDRLLVPVGATFFTYVRAQSQLAPAAAGAAVPTAAGYKLTRLPMNYDRYVASCKPKIMGPKGRPQTSDKCAPDYYPYVADPASSDMLMKIIGNHDYAMGGHEYTSGFSPPFKQKVAATFLVFPPMKQVILVRVDDFEVVRNEARDVMTGVYLSIVDGKVVDQISGCHFNRDYVCVDEDREIAVLAPNGRFVRKQ